MGRGNPKAFEGVREATQFKAAGDEPLTAKVDLRLTPGMADDLKAIKNWQAKLRGAIAHLIADELEQGQLNRDSSAEDGISTKPTSTTGDGGQTPATGNTGGAKGKGKTSPRARKAARTGSS